LLFAAEKPCVEPAPQTLIFGMIKMMPGNIQGRALGSRKHIVISISPYINDKLSCNVLHN